MSDTQQQQQQVDHLKHQIDTGAQEAKSYLDKLKKNIHEYDEKHPSAHKATDALCSGLDTAESSVNELAHVGAKLKAKSKNASDQSMELARETLLKVKASLCALQDKAHEYDAKFTGSTGTKVAGEVSDSVESIVNSMRQRTIDAIEMATEQITRMSDSAQNAAGTAAHGAQVTVGETLHMGDKVDEKLGVTEKASSAAGVVAETVKNIDRRMQVTETAAAIDSKVTGGLGARVVNKGVEMVQGSIEYVTETLQQAKNAATKSGTAQTVDEKAASAIDNADATVGAAQDKVAAAKDQAADAAGTAREKTVSAKDQATGAAYNARDKTTETAGSMKDQAIDAAYNARDKTAEMAISAKDQAVGAAYNARDKTAEMATSAKDQVIDGAYNARDKTLDLATSAKDQVIDAAYIARDKTMEMAGLAKQSAEETAKTAKHKAQDTTGAAEQKGADMYEGARQGAENAKQSVHETAKTAKHKAQDTHKGSDITRAGTASGTSTHSDHIGSSGHESTGSGSNDLVFSSVNKHAAYSNKSETPAGNVVIEVKNADTVPQSTDMKNARKA